MQTLWFTMLLLSITNGNSIGSKMKKIHNESSCTTKFWWSCRFTNICCNTWIGSLGQPRLQTPSSNRIWIQHAKTWKSNHLVVMFVKCFFVGHWFLIEFYNWYVVRTQFRMKKFQLHVCVFTPKSVAMRFHLLCFTIWNNTWRTWGSKMQDLCLILFVLWTWIHEVYRWIFFETKIFIKFIVL